MVWSSGLVHWFSSFSGRNFVTQIQVDIGDSNQGPVNQGPPAGTPSTPGQVNEEFWLNMTDPNPNTEPMGQSEFDKFLAKSK